ncbi:hypothetical protein BFN03_04840 [Rhodococcus sp. WMMA185]|uniref:hypothetical protein n=1 Tax=Rhodococcus sp. WMMA185 TaxID=679318 RepID=UPI000878C765|nr:hypothetical protein [Rhodococcus sp. WMMA185]AOW92264.1 hypothetical protein BFN03_04840 [Rhodococcus sp. WMMA185]
MGTGAGRVNPKWDETDEAGRWLADELDQRSTVGAAVPRRYPLCVEIPRTRVQYPELVEATEGSGVVRAAVLVDALEHLTKGQICHFAVWEGWGYFGRRATRLAYDIPSEGILLIPHQQMRYHLWSGPVSEFSTFAREWTDPSFVWPEDRRWCLGSSVDSTATYLGGDNAVAAAVLGAPELDARIVDRSAEQAFPDR